MKIYKILATMEYEAELEIEAETYEEAKSTAQDMVGDGLALRNAELTDYSVEELPTN